MAAKTIIDWLTVEQDYITSNMTYKELSEKHKLNYLTVKKKACDNSWREKRGEHQRKVVNKAVNKIATKKADKIAEITNNILDALLNATKELKDYEEVNSSGEIVKLNLSTVQVKKLETIVRSITQIQRVQFEKERVQLEKQKIQSDDNVENKLSEFLDVIKEEIKP